MWQRPPPHNAGRHTTPHNAPRGPNPPLPRGVEQGSMASPAPNAEQGSTASPAPKPSREEVQRILDAHDIPNKLQAALNDALASQPAAPIAHMAAALGPRTFPRPRTAAGPFLRVVTVNDVYRLDNYPRVATAVAAAKADADGLDCVVTSTCNGDFLSPCTLTALDGGRAMTEALNCAGIEFVGIGNHEFDFGFEVFVARMDAFKGKAVNSNISNKELAGLPRYSILSVGERKVVVTGLITEDTSIYAPANTPAVTPGAEAAAQVWELAKAELGGATPDLHLPMTHALVPEDKRIALALAKHEELGDRTPVILGGHEHDLYIDEAGKSVIVKLGQDAERIGFVDIWWTAEGSLRSRVQYLPCTEFEEDAACAEFVKRQKDFLTRMMTTPIATLPRAMSSKKVRFEPSGVASFLLTFVRRCGLRSQATRHYIRPPICHRAAGSPGPRPSQHPPARVNLTMSPPRHRGAGAEVAMVQGGFIRYKKDYEPGPFLMGDLFGEFAFEGAQAVVELPGAVLQASCRFTREAPKPAPLFLHFDTGVEIDAETHEIRTIGGKPFESEKMYKVVIYQFLLSGLNVIDPLIEYVKSSGMVVPDLESCRPVKDMVLEVMVKDEWRQLIGADSWDSDGDGCVSGDELKTGIHKVMQSMDRNGDGVVSRAELEEFMSTKHGNLQLIEQMISTLDADGDGMLSMEELKALAF